MSRERIRRKRLAQQKLLGAIVLILTAVMVYCAFTTDFFVDGGIEAVFFTIPMGIGLLVSNEVIFD